MSRTIASLRVLIMAGGTGGHVIPGLAVAEYLRSQGAQVAWLGTRRGIEATLVPRAGLPIHYLSVEGLRGKGLASWLAAPFKLSTALLQALAVLRRERPQVVLGMGGFASGPGGVASWLMRRPLLVHEQNAVAGLTNRWLSRLAACVLEGFPGTFAGRGAVLATGNPVRAAIAALPEPARRFAGRSGPLRVLVIGGSLGAQALNELVPAALTVLPAAERPEVWHQTGARHLEATERRYAEAGVQARVAPFIDDMAEAYGWADLVLCRAGALTVAELAATGLASVLVPYPHAVDDHQTRNAAYLAQAGAAWLIQQQDLTPEGLRDLLHTLTGAAGRPRLLDMAKAARRLALPDATAKVAAQCLEVAHG